MIAETSPFSPLKAQRTISRELSMPLRLRSVLRMRATRFDSEFEATALSKFSYEP